jgi:hypothetical protein
MNKLLPLLALSSTNFSISNFFPLPSFYFFHFLFPSVSSYSSPKGKYNCLAYIHTILSSATSNFFLFSALFFYFEIFFLFALSLSLKAHTRRVCEAHIVRAHSMSMHENWECLFLHIPQQRRWQRQRVRLCVSFCERREQSFSFFPSSMRNAFHSQNIKIILVTIPFRRSK